MNERIKQLAEQAWVYQMTVYEDNGVRTFGEREQVFSKEKFAQLIVKECLHIVDDEGAGEGGCIRAMIRIQEEFGVEA